MNEISMDEMMKRQFGNYKDNANIMNNKKEYDVFVELDKILINCTDAYTQQKNMIVIKELFTKIRCEYFELKRKNEILESRLIKINKENKKTTE